MSKLKKVTLTVVVREEYAQETANKMENSTLAQEGMHTLVCGEIEDLKHWEEQEVLSMLDVEAIEEF